MTSETVGRAQGRWREVLPQLGVETRYLVNRYGPCPLCGGRDRFRFDDRDGSGSYFCNQCGAGNGFILIRKLHGWDFPTAAAAVDRVIGSLRFGTKSTGTRNPIDGEPRRQRVIAAMNRAQSPEVVVEYLHRRGLSIVSPVLRGDAGAAFYDGATRQLIGYFRAVLAPIVNIAGKLVSAQAIYLDAPVKKKTLAPGINSCAIRLFEPTDELAVTEGVENGIAYTELYGIPAWAALNDNGVATFAPPPEIRRLIIAGDHDESFAGQCASFTLAKRLRRERSQLMVEVHLPPEVGVDWNDVLLDKKTGLI